MKIKIIVCFVLMIMLVPFQLISESRLIEVEGEPGLFIPFDEIEYFQMMFPVNYHLIKEISSFTATLEQAKRKLLNTFNQVLVGTATIEQFQSEFQLFYSVMNYANLDFYSNLDYLSQFASTSATYFDEVMTEYINIIEE